MDESIFNASALAAVIIVLIGIIHGLLGFFYQFRLIVYLSKLNPQRVRKISRAYNPFNPIQFIVYVFNDDDCDDQTINTYKGKLRYFLKIFIVALILLGLLLIGSSV